VIVRWPGHLEISGSLSASTRDQTGTTCAGFTSDPSACVVEAAGCVGLRRPSLTRLRWVEVMLA